jgi:hypothetical protein
LLNEDFDDGVADGWIVGSGKWSVTSSLYRESRTTAGYRNETFYANGTLWTDYTFSADVKWGGGSAKTGINFRCDVSGTNCYTFRITNGTTLDLGKRVAGTFTALTSWSGYSFRSSTWYTLKVVAKGSLLTFYVNGSQVGSYTDSSHSSGTVGLYTYQGAGDFDNVLVTATTPTTAATQAFAPNPLVADQIAALLGDEQRKAGTVSARPWLQVRYTVP